LVSLFSFSPAGSNPRPLFQWLNSWRKAVYFKFRHFLPVSHNVIYFFFI
jgi:hypothetical protein